MWTTADRNFEFVLYYNGETYVINIRYCIEAKNFYKHTVSSSISLHTVNFFFTIAAKHITTLYSVHFER